MSIDQSAMDLLLAALFFAGILFIGIGITDSNKAAESNGTEFVDTDSVTKTK